MCGTSSVGTTPTIATNPTPLSGGGASTSTTSVAGASGGGALPAPPVAGAVAGATGGGATGLDSLGPLLAQVSAAVESLKQALGGGALLGGGAPSVGGGGPGGAAGGCGCGMPGCGGSPEQAPPSPVQVPPTPEQKPDQKGDKGAGDDKAEEKQDKKPKKDKKPKGTGTGGDTPPPPPPSGGTPPAGGTPPTGEAPPTPPTGGGAGAAPATPPATPTQTQLIQTYKEKYWAWEALYTQRKALRSEIVELTRQRDSFTSGGPDAIARNRLTEQIRVKQKTYDDGFAAINQALIARNDAFRAAGLPRAIPPGEL